MSCCSFPCSGFLSTPKAHSASRLPIRSSTRLLLLWLFCLLLVMPMPTPRCLLFPSRWLKSLAVCMLTTTIVSAPYKPWPSISQKNYTVSLATKAIQPNKYCWDLCSGDANGATSPSSASSLVTSNRFFNCPITVRLTTFLRLETPIGLPHTLKNCTKATTMAFISRRATSTTTFNLSCNCDKERCLKCSLLELVRATSGGMRPPISFRLR